MQKRFFLLLLTLTTATLTAWAQIPVSVAIPRISAQLRTPLACAGIANAGATTRTLSVNNKNLADIRYLCLGDTLFIAPKVPITANLTEDPVPATTPGIGYLFYNCKPTISGSRYSDVKLDPCLSRNPTSMAFLISRGEANGRDTFFNNGALQRVYAAGRPIKFYFAPATVYDLFGQGSSGQADFESDTACVNVNVNDRMTPTDTFSVVYLNRVQANVTSLNATGGTFTVSGGLPEYDGTSSYTIKIALSTNPAILGAITGGSPARNGSTLTFTVPQDGKYNITATDGKSCDGVAQAIFPNITFKLSNENVLMGDTACVKVTALNFNSMFSTECNFQFDPSVLRYVGPRNFNLPSLDANSFNLVTGTNVIAFSWNGPAAGTTRADNTTLFELCFKAIGSIGTITPIRITDSLNPIDIHNAAGTLFGLNRLNGSVTIGTTEFFINKSSDSSLCNGDLSRFRIWLTGTGGAPFTYVWRSATNPGLTNVGQLAAIGDTATVQPLPAGLYYISVTNAGGVTKTDSITIKQPNVLFLNAPTAVNPTCSDNRDGSLTLTNYGGGTAPYTFRWSTNATTTAITGLASGPYGVTMTDAHGCKDSIPRVSIGVNPIIITSSNIVPATCKGINVGSVTINGVQGGTPTSANNYTFLWSTGATNVGPSSIISSLAPGTYYVTISDKNNCTKRDSFIVTPTRSLLVNATVGNITCFGQNNAFVNATAFTSGPESRPYTFTWTGNVGTPQNTAATTFVRSLMGGNYPLSIRDRDGCRLDTIFRITEPDSIKVTLASLKHESCLNGGRDGQININVTGGLPRNGLYNYLWSRSPQDTLTTIARLAAGNYSVTITDSVGCTKVKTYTILPPVYPIIDSFSVKNATCSDRNDGSAKVFTRPGTGNILTSILWSNTSFIDSISNVVAGLYTVTITANNSCQKIDSVRITAPGVIAVDSARSSVTNPVCPNDPTGQIILVVKGGTAPYAYTWSNGSNTANPVFSSLSAGTYMFTVTDANNCTSLLTSITLVDPPAIKVAFTDMVPITCYGKCGPGDGKVTAIASGGTANTGRYTFTWIGSGETCNSSNTCRATQLCGQSQSVIVSDGICGVIDSTIIGQPDSFSIFSPSINQPSCNGDRDGSARINVQGGRQPYIYAWSNGSTANTIVNVPVGRYTLSITDANSCRFDYALDIKEPQILKVDTVGFGKTLNPTCYGLSDGTIKLKRNGGNGGVTTYQWLPSVSRSDSALDLKAGVYSIVATDIKGCKDSITVNLTQPDPIFFYMPPLTQPRCNGELTTIRIDTAFGSTYLHPFSVSVDNGPQYPIGYYVPVFAGQHQISVIEQVTGCILDSTITIQEPPALVIKFDTITNSTSIARILVGLGDSVRLNPRITSALPIDSVKWTPKDYLTFRNDPLRPFVRPIDDRTYKLTIVDVNGCSTEESIFVEVDRNRNIFIPNIFSPNGDDKNDYFGVFNGVGVKMINFIRIYDRWGELLFTKAAIAPNGDISQGWDGSFKSKPMQNGVYVYIIEVAFEDGQKLLYRGDITIVR